MGRGFSVSKPGTGVYQEWRKPNTLGMLLPKNTSKKIVLDTQTHKFKK